jgi:mono/diheme cytochrome c family protein
VVAALVGAAACASKKDDSPLDFPDPGPGGKTDVFGRKLAGVPSDYVPAELDEDTLQSNARARRDAAWESVFKVLEQVPLLGLAESAGENPEDIELPEGEVPRVPRFQTWYGVDDIKRMFQHLYEGLAPADRAVRAPFTTEQIADAVKWNAGALDRSKRWPFERYLEYVKQLGVCPEEMPADECARLVQSKVTGAGGNARIMYSPGTVEHVLGNYQNIVRCLGELGSLSLAALPISETNFTLCFDAEFPTRSVLIKAQWARADFGKQVPAYDTDGDTLAAHIGGTAHWGDEGDRTVDPSPSDIFTIRLKNGDTYRLVGLHIMTKELRHWQWITLWWSDKPDTDFGADRPDKIKSGLPGVWSNYKMCVVDGFQEKDTDGARRYPGKPTLAAALRAIDSGAGGPTWCSNPYLEEGRNNARTNCVGCHQHGGSTVIRDEDGDGALEPLDLEAIINDETHFPLTGRKQIREVFPADYLYSFNKVDDFAHLITAEISFFDDADRDAVRSRRDHILSMDGVASAGAMLFAQNCATCHGEDGRGSGWAPNLYERVPTRPDDSIVQTLLQGRGGMPKWEHLRDQEIADLLAHLRATFGGSSE